MISILNIQSQRSTFVDSHNFKCFQVILQKAQSLFLFHSKEENAAGVLVYLLHLCYLKILRLNRAGDLEGCGFMLGKHACPCSWSLAGREGENASS